MEKKKWSEMTPEERMEIIMKADQMEEELTLEQRKLLPLLDELAKGFGDDTEE